MHYYAPYLCIITNERQRNADPAFRNAFSGILCTKKKTRIIQFQIFSKLFRLFVNKTGRPASTPLPLSGGMTSSGSLLQKPSPFHRERRDMPDGAKSTEPSVFPAISHPR